MRAAGFGSRTSSTGNNTATTGEERQYCEYPSGISLGTFYWHHLCPYTSCSGDEGPYENCLEPTTCVWTTDDESQCLPTCDLTETAVRRG